MALVINGIFFDTVRLNFYLLAYDNENFRIHWRVLGNRALKCTIQQRRTFNC